MKTWTMPIIRVEAYAANEYVAGCSWSGDLLNITCEYGSDQHAQFVNPTHGYGGDPNTLSIPRANWNQFSTRGTWFSSDGTYVHKGGANAIPDEYKGDHVYYCYVYTRGDGSKWLIWTDYTWSTRYNDYTETVANHRTGYGTSGNPES